MRNVPSRTFAFVFVWSGLALAQPPKKSPPPIRNESASSISFSTIETGQLSAEIRNVTYEVTGTAIPALPSEERLLLRNTTKSKEIIGDEGIESTLTLEAWPLGQDPRQKPLYSLTVEGADGKAVDNALYVVLRGLEETPWWTVYRLGSGQRMFDTYVPLLSFSISHDVLTTRYVGLDAPADDTKDARLKQPNVVAVVTYASESKVIREALVTCDDPRKAALLRSFADSSRTLTLVEDAYQTERTLRLLISVDYPSPPEPMEIRIPVRNDDLDLAHAQLPAKMHIAAWKR